ncbi:chaperonin 10-like protein [Clohesyomyces aquaticus]|uniref:Chaperonin 10-like protein n=1 Tax=Clohesyomyces aquaticus TaxID=1231657 RepID=A0A1Y1ZWR6_9PLEO|nr:chaperonin 10-like protein [Clohesyomyces aquaticus]
MFQRSESTLEVPQSQSVLLLHKIRQPYQLASGHPVPSVQSDDELLVKILAVGLNPIDWKAPDFNFGIPTLPYVSGRECAGLVVQAPTSTNQSRRIRKGDVVIIPSTDYRDLRKATFQEYAITSSVNTIRLPRSLTPESGSTFGVAFVASALALGICMGVNFEEIQDGPDILSIVRSIDPDLLPSDVRNECLHGIQQEERAHSGDFLVIWGGSSTCAHTAKQLARLAGLKIISVVDHTKHGLRLSNHADIRPDLLVDSHDPERAIQIIRSATEGRARFGFDTAGKETAGHLLQGLSSAGKPVSLPQDLDAYGSVKSDFPTPPSTPSNSTKSAAQRAHLVGLTGLPKGEIPEGVALHSVPIKLFHEIPEVGEALSAWAEQLLASGLVKPPDVVGTVDGLGEINDGLDRLRRREISGGRLVARIS